MLKEQLDAVSDQLMSDDNAEIRQKIFNAYQEEPERGADMIISFATDKGLKLDATADEVVNHLENLDEEVDIEMTPEELASVSGGFDSLRAAMSNKNNFWAQMNNVHGKASDSAGDYADHRNFNLPVH